MTRKKNKIQTGSSKHVLKKRSAGVLLHITCLPSPFGIGDFGPEARLFADFIHRAGQKYWQVLPLSPTDISPYSAHSSMAGNTLLISPESLVQAGFLDANDLHGHILPNEEVINYPKAERIKSSLFNKAYTIFRKEASETWSNQFSEFCRDEAYWLNDYALFSLLKKAHHGSAWFLWPKSYKLRDKDTLTKFENEHLSEIDKIKWLQFIFTRQWGELKNYCNAKGILLFGDLPIYVSYDSADVWSNTDIFNLDKEGAILGMAGVPPDYFSTTGQLWGMPVYRWNVLKNRHYDWWIQRIRKNMALYDLVRIDHFRAFAEYWEVPANELTAINGTWKTGPGSDFFRAIQKEFGSMPFVAEDLGEVNDLVYRLRDKFGLPGMKILQFAFDENMPHSNHIPHNYQSNFAVYTGTHDNNTTLGWFRQETDKKTRKRLADYTGKRINETNIYLVLAELAYASVAKLCILPMQDVLGLNETARMNTPGTIERNWSWRLKHVDMHKTIEKRLIKWVKIYNR